MLKRCCLVLAAGCLALSGHAAAADPATEKDRLRSLLESKFKKPAAKTTRSIRPAVPAAPPADLYVIDPSGKVKNIAPGTPGNSSAVPPSDMRLTASASGGVLSLAAGATGLGNGRSAPAVVAAADEPPATEAAADVMLAASTESTVVNQRIIVIQLKPRASEADIDALITKYNLDVIEVVPSLGAMYVRLPNAPAEKSSRSTVRSLLEPNLVVQLRREPAVNAAFVQSTIGTKTLPPPTTASVRQSSGVTRWHWETGSNDDGNWGLKAMRIPQVWTVVRRGNRQPDPTSPAIASLHGIETAAAEGPKPATIALLDSGFGEHPQIAYTNVKGGMPARPQPADCARSHGTHVAGIISANVISTNGIDGIVPQARLDAIPISRNLLIEGSLAGAQRQQLHLGYFADVIRDLAEYFDEYPLADDERRVVNVSLAYNWSWVRKMSETDPTTDQSVRNQIQQHANFIQYLVDRVSDQVLFVAAAGNDSEGESEPFNAKLATPFAFAALHESAYFTPSSNIIVIEAHGRDGNLASFSNTGGHVSAPGVDIMSTLASDKAPYGVCSGTSQAAPHVTALAAILFGLDPKRTPAEIISLIRASTIAEPGSRAAPRADGLAAVASLSDQYVRQLADLDGDGDVDAADLAVFREDLLAIEAGRYGDPIDRDLNGDGAIDGSERCWPRIDLNGSGRASYDSSDVRPIGGVMRSDLEMIRAAWTDRTETFDTALRNSGLAELLNIWQATAIMAAAELPLADDVPCR
ncbi:MAG: S8 family serine peptidase [Hyphomicrobiaceae bacterium]|nr:S8 family serine peptidase [Hyphomicrobiaceae bacterium]